MATKHRARNSSISKWVAITRLLAWGRWARGNAPLAHRKPDSAAAKQGSDGVVQGLDAVVAEQLQHFV